VTLTPDAPGRHDDDWVHDPWDDADAALAVERLRRHNRAVKWVVWSAFLIVTVLVLVAGATGWWYINRINPGVTDTAAGELHDRRRRHPLTVSERLEAEGIITDAGVFRWYVERNGDLEITPGFYQVQPGDHMGNIWPACAPRPSARSPR
jgi:UPF0755 protein